METMNDTEVFANFKNTNRNRLRLESFAIIFGFMIGFSLCYVGTQSGIEGMAFNERFANQKIYPDFMKSAWIMGINGGIWYAVCLCAISQLFFDRISDMASGIKMVLFLLVSSILLYSTALTIATCFHGDIAFITYVLLFRLFDLITIGGLGYQHCLPISFTLFAGRKKAFVGFSQQFLFSRTLFADSSNMVILARDNVHASLTGTFFYRTRRAKSGMLRVKRFLHRKLENFWKWGTIAGKFVPLAQPFL